MTALTLARPFTPVLKALGKVFSVFENIAKSIEEARMISSTLNELNDLSDSELRDLGIHRSQIAGIALAAARGEKFNG